jgi:CSLREA domain-containing protein
MRTQTSGRGLLWCTKAKTLAVGLIVAAMMAAGLASASPTRASTTFTVNSTADTPDASLAGTACDTDVFTNGDQCTLRAAIQQANATAGADAISFAIPGTGVKTINVGATGFGSLPAITEQVTIDGYTQPGSSRNTLAVGDNAVLRVELAGNGAGGTGLTIKGISAGSVIRGLAINRFGEGIDIQGDTAGNRIEGNFIGTDPTGTIDTGNTDGVNVFDGPSENVIGGTTSAARNVISGNACNAVFVNKANNNRIQGNYVGTDKTGTKGLTNGDGFECAGIAFSSGSSGNTVGGTTAGASNLISGNRFDGLLIQNGAENEVLGNRIGTTANGTGALGNGEAGVLIQGSNNAVGNGTSAGLNTIAFNAEDGVEVQTGTGHEISRNSIFSNAGLGIDLHGGFEDASGNTANDPGDIDTGANGLQNKPVITSAKSSSTKTTITGKLASVPDTLYRVEFYANPSGDEGKTFVGATLLSTDASGNASFTFSPASKVAAGQTVTATARAELNEVTAVGTSEFSAPSTVSDATAPTVKAISPAQNATGVSPKANVSAVFSEAMNSSTINATTVTLKRAGASTKVGATISYDAAKKKATLNPKTNLKLGATYAATVTTGAKDVAGNALDQSPSLAGNQAMIWKVTIKK